jgi:hypothetical protein
MDAVRWGVGKYYLRVFDVKPYPDHDLNKVTQCVSLQVQKTPFKLKPIANPKRSKSTQPSDSKSSIEFAAPYHY